MTDNEIAIQALLAAKNSADWAFWAMIGTWFSGIATFMAVCLTLYISNRRPKPKLAGTVTLSFLTGSHYSIPGVGISIANQGLTSAIITSLTWTYGAKNSLLQFVGEFGDNLPKKIEHGESAFFFIRNEEDARWDSKMKLQIRNQGGKIRKLILLVHLGSGDVIKIKPARNVVHLVEQA